MTSNKHLSLLYFWVNLSAKIWGCHGTPSTPRDDTPGVSTSDSEAKSINNATSSEDFSKIQRKYIKNSCCIRERFLLTSFEKFEDIFFSFVSVASYHRKDFYRKEKKCHRKGIGYSCSILFLDYFLH